MNSMLNDADEKVRNESKDFILELIDLVEKLQPYANGSYEQENLLNYVREAKENWLANECITQDQVKYFAKELMSNISGQLQGSLQALKMLAYDLPVCIDKLNRINAPSIAEAKLEMLIRSLVGYVCPNKIAYCERELMPVKTSYETCLNCWREYLEKNVREVETPGPFIRMNNIRARG